MSDTLMPTCETPLIEIFGSAMCCPLHSYRPRCRATTAEPMNRTVTVRLRRREVIRQLDAEGAGLALQAALPAQSFPEREPDDAVPAVEQVAGKHRHVEAALVQRDANELQPPIDHGIAALRGMVFNWVEDDPVL